jgi:hypothetical protein
MAKQIARLLRTDVMADIDIPAIAQFLQSQGRRGDSILAHINAREAALLKKNGGAETVNPVTGLPEYFVIGGGYEYGADYGNQINQNLDIPQEALPDFQDYYEVPAGGGEIPFDIPMDASAPRELPITVSAPSVSAPAFELPQMPIYDRGGMRAAPAPVLQPEVIRPDLTVPTRTAAPTLTTEEKGMIGKGIDELSKSTGLSRQALGQLGLAGLGTLQGVMAAREASAQGRQARRETEAIAQPYVQRGRELTEQAARGELTAQGQQSLQALRARLAQGAEARGGVGAAQAAAQIEAFRQNLLQNQFDYGQKISNIGDQLMLGAIRTGLEADRYAANLSNTYFTNMARVAAGIPSGVPTGTQGAQ